MRDEDLPIGMMGQPASVIARFRRIVASGESARIAEMLSVRKGPALDTDTVHFAGFPRLEDTAGPAYAQKVREQARKAGIQVSDSSIFNGSIADERQGADPGAWLLAGDGKAKFKRTVRDRGGACETLGVEFGESQERMDKEQTRLAGIRKRNNERKTVNQQMKAGQKV